MNVSRILKCLGLISAAVSATPTNVPCDYFKAMSSEASGTLSSNPTDKVSSCYVNIRRLIKDEDMGLRQMQMMLYINSANGGPGKIIIDDFIFAGVTPDHKLDMAVSAVSLHPTLKGTVQFIQGNPGQLVATIEKNDIDANKKEVVTTENVEITTNRIFTAVEKIHVRDSLSGADVTCIFKP